MTKYIHGNNTLDLFRSLGSVYKDGKLLFKGDGYVALKIFIYNTGNDEKVLKKFKSQLDMREECKYKKQDEKNKEDLKISKLQKEKEEKPLELNKKFKKRGRGV